MINSKKIKHQKTHKQKMLCIKKNESTLLASWGLLLGNHRATIPQINPNLYSVPKAIAVKIKKDQSTRKKRYFTETMVSTDGRTTTDIVNRKCFRKIDIFK